jgi:methylglutaconyl-CoA hydratase
MTENKTAHANTKATLNISEGVATIVLNQPEKHNAFDDQIIQNLLAHLALIRKTPSIYAMVLRAEGKNFCAGADLAWMKRMAKASYEANEQDALQLAKLMSELNALPIPTVVLVQGAAFGGALGLIACCDIAISADNAKFCLSEVKLGLAPATISPYVLTAIGARRCRHLFLTAEVFNAEQAYDWGLVHKRCAHDQLKETLKHTLNQLASNGPLACRASKQLIFDVLDNADDLIEQTSKLIAKLRVSEEGQEGLNAFFEKRPAAWIRQHND